MNKKRVLFVIPSLSAGGAERVISFLASNLNKKKFIVKLIVINSKKNNAYEVNDKDLVYFNKKRLLFSIHLLIYQILKFKPSIVFGSIAHVNITLGFLAFFFRKISFIARDSSVFSHRIKFTNSNERLMSYLIKMSYPHLKFIVCQSNDMKIDLLNTFKFNAEKMRVINNPITINKNIKIKEVKDKNILRFITIGRLSREKGILRILKCLSQIREYQFFYTLIGDGIMRDEIMIAIKKFGLFSKVNYIEFTDKVLDRLVDNDYFLQGSYVEGFPNALLESCSVGTPFIAFNAPGGTKEIHEPLVNGYLVENEIEYTNILRTITEKPRFERSKVIKSVVDKFSSKKILLEYENLLNEI